MDTNQMRHDDQKHWYVVRVRSGCEEKVKKALEQRINQEGLNDKFGHILVPTEKVVELRGGQKVKSERRFYPGYLIVEMIMDPTSWHIVRSLSRDVQGFLGDVERPVPVRPKEIATVLRYMEDSTSKPKPKILFEIGEIVRVIHGPFREFNGVVEEVNYEKNRLNVAVLIFGRSTPVELQFDQVEKS